MAGWPSFRCSAPPTTPPWNSYAHLGHFIAPENAVNFCKGCGRHWLPPEPSSGRCGHCKEQVLWIDIPPSCQLKIVPFNGPATKAELERWNVEAEEWTPEAQRPESSLASSSLARQSLASHLRHRRKLRGVNLIGCPPSAEFPT